MRTPAIAKRRRAQVFLSSASRTSRRRRRRSARGMTLIEIMIVVALIAMIAGSVAVMATNQAVKARLTQASTDARSLRLTALGASALQVEEGCPTVESLRAERLLDKGSNPLDPWGQPFVIACADEEVTVSSPGPDRRLGTEDDVAVP